MIEKYNIRKHNPVTVKELLAMSLGHPTPERLHKTLSEFYAEQKHTLFISSNRDTITGVIGVDDTAVPYGWIAHLAVHPSFRMRGIGRSLIEQIMKALSLQSVALKTDQEAVEFYRACGFQTVEIESQWPETRRYRCTKGHMPEFVLEYYDKLIIP